VLKKRSGAQEESVRQIGFVADGVHLSEPLPQLRGVLTGVPMDLSASLHDER
jgi:circadian clock protein KaiC